MTWYQINSTHYDKSRQYLFGLDIGQDPFIGVSEKYGYVRNGYPSVWGTHFHQRTLIFKGE
jgi:hypothetical protein